MNIYKQLVAVIFVSFSVLAMEQKQINKVKSLKQRAGEVVSNTGQLHKITISDLKYDTQLAQEVYRLTSFWHNDNQILFLIINNTQNIELLTKLYAEYEDSIIRLYRTCQDIHCELLVQLLLNCYLRVTARTDAVTLLMQAVIFRDRAQLNEQINKINLNDHVLYEPFMTSPLIEASRRGYSDFVELLLARQMPIDGADVVGRTALMAAASNGHLELVKLLLAQGAAINMQDTMGKTAIWLATKQGHTSTVEYLLNKGAQVSVNINPLILAVKFGNDELFSLWLNSGMCTQQHMNEALIISIELGCVQMAGKLLRAGADHNYECELTNITPLMAACANKNHELVCLLLDHHADWNRLNLRGNSALLSMVLFGDKKLMDVVIERGADFISTDKQLLLVSAARTGNYETVQYLIDLGLDVEETDYEGNTALLVSAQNGFAAIVRLLICKGASTDRADCTGNTALMWATIRKRMDVVKALLDAGAEINCVNKENMSALQLACEFSCYQIAELLLEHGADVNIRDWRGNTPLYNMALRGKEAFVKLLLRHKADITIANDQGDTVEFRAQSGGMTGLLQLINDHKNKSNNLDKK